MNHLRLPHLFDVCHPALLLLVSAGPLVGQSSLGNWVHPAVDNDVYVGPNPAPNPTGTSPSDPLPTLSAAVALADSILGQSPARSGVTINVIPGTYSITSDLDLPAFGVCIEAYRELGLPAGAAVTIDISGVPTSQAGAIRFSRTLGVQAAALGNPTSSYAPSELRGLNIVGGVGTAVGIDPWSIGPPVATGDVVEVGIRECQIVGAGGGVTNQSVAIRILGGGVISTPPGGQVAGTVRMVANYGAISPLFLEAETYIQCLVLRVDGTGSFSNRLRVDIDQ